MAFYLIHSERYSKIHAARTRDDQMRLLYQALDSGGDQVKSDFYRILLDLEPDLVKTLGKNLSTSGYISLEYKPYLVYHLGKNLSTGCIG